MSRYKIPANGSELVLDEFDELDELKLELDNELELDELDELNELDTEELVSFPLPGSLFGVEHDIKFSIINKTAIKNKIENL